MKYGLVCGGGEPLGRVPGGTLGRSPCELGEWGNEVRREPDFFVDNVDACAEE